MSVPIPLSSNYSDTRRPTDEQRKVNMYPHTKGGYRQFPGLVQFGSIADTASLINSLDVSAEIGAGPVACSPFMSRDGTILYVADADTIYQYTLTTPFRTKSATYASKSFDYDSGVTAGTIATFYVSDDGLNAYLAYAASNIIYELDLSSPGDISTATYNSNNFDTSTDLGSEKNYGITFNPGETRLIVLSNGENVYGYTMTSGDITSASYASETFDVSGQVTSARGIDVSADGKTFWVADDEADVEKYTIATGWDFSAAVHSAGLGLTLGGSGNGNIGPVFRNGARRFYVSKQQSAEIQEYSLGGVGRGVIEMAGVAYAVVGDSLYSVDSFGAATSKGTILDSPSLVSMETDGTQLVICTGTTIYRFTAPSTLTTITDADINDTANSSAYLDLRFWYQQPSGQFVTSAVDDATSIDALDFATAESFADDILRAFAHNEMIYFFGETSTEPWRTSTGRPPADRQRVIERGVVGTFSVNSIDDRVYFVDQERRVNVLSGLQYTPIPVPALDLEFGSYTVVSDCVVSVYSLNRENFVEVFFPSEDVSWTMHEPSGEWIKREDSNNDKFRAIGYVNVYGKLLCLDHANGKLYKLTDTTYQDDGSNITRTMDTDKITSEAVGVADREMNVATLYLTLECTGAGSVSVSAAYDGGAFQTARTITTVAGKETYSLDSWGDCWEVVFRLTTTSAVGIDFLSASITGEALNG